MKKLLGELQLLQREVIDIVRAIADENYPQQFHPDLSPIGWHLGHCVYTESYWIREELFNQETTDELLKHLYAPKLSNKQFRGSALPEKTELLEWATITQSENIALLESGFVNNKSHQLLENNYLIHFLIQHYSQHIETMCMVLTEMQIKQLKTIFTTTNNLVAIKPISKIQIIEAGSYNIGSNEKNGYDNERPAQSINLNNYKISTHPVSNAEYLYFIEDGAYSAKQYWSDDGWQWINKNKYKQPHHWHLQNDNNYYGVNHQGAYELEEGHPVHGLSYFEAEAYAKWIGARLPHEYEWEAAARENYLEQTSLVWEWCSNTFHPYENFSAYPYEGYSAPYFDEKHYVLRGGSSYTKKQINRASFRNYYTADKRHMFAGMRLVYD
ncbi:MAG TPA: ergothioneine biosynthesis protein EgtB [Thiotrichaceae bacterium]|jgi:iron(II)-dependent oxidoreductase|nr:ergothioneine biosynthesis protein EgtB [Thiotrichaceae bacterium]HIM07769.1 ergothioneine biosynthesis protein EgtB [Gammaproteobacteria bacterium]